MRCFSRRNVIFVGVQIFVSLIRSKTSPEQIKKCPILTDNYRISPNTRKHKIEQARRVIVYWYVMWAVSFSPLFEYYQRKQSLLVLFCYHSMFFCLNKLLCGLWWLMLAHDERKVVVMNPIIYQDFTLSLSTNSRLSIVSETPTDTDERNDPAEQTKWQFLVP